MIINETQEKAVKETYKKLIAIYLFWIVLFSVTFYKTNLTINLSVSTGLFIFYILVPYIVFILLGKDYSIKEFSIIASVYVGITLLASYYIAIIGINVKYHFILLPCMIILISYIINKKIRNKKLKVINDE